MNKDLLCVEHVKDVLQRLVHTNMENKSYDSCRNYCIVQGFHNFWFDQKIIIWNYYLP